MKIVVIGLNCFAKKLAGTTHIKWLSFDTYKHRVEPAMEYAIGLWCACVDALEIMLCIDFNTISEFRLHDIFISFFFLSFPFNVCLDCGGVKYVCVWHFWGEISDVHDIVYDAQLSRDFFLLDDRVWLLWNFLRKWIEYFEFNILNWKRWPETIPKYCF